VLPRQAISGVVFAYDEAQNLADHSERNQFPISILLEVFQSSHRKEIPFLLVLTDLPTLGPKLVAAGTYAERVRGMPPTTLLYRRRCVATVISAASVLMSLKRHIDNIDGIN
jgi:hypothetical protein